MAINDLTCTTVRPPQVEALAGTEVVGDPIYVTIDVLDINNNAPYFEQNAYTTEIREHSQPGVWQM